MASTGDKITDTRNAARPNSARVTSGRSAAGSTLACDNLAGWPTASKVHFVTYTVDSNSNPVAGSQLDCYGIVSGNNINSFTVSDGTDTGNSVGDYVEMLPTAAWGQDLADALTAEHSRTGTHAAITSTSISNAGTLTQTGAAALASTLNVTGVATFSGGTTLPAGDIIFADLLSTIFSGQVLTQANAGTAGGTFSYINLGGIKLLWCISANQSTGASSLNYTFTLPVGFFSSLTAVSANPVNMTTDNRQNVAVAATPSTTTITVAAWYPLGGSATVGINLFVIGT